MTARTPRRLATHLIALAALVLGATAATAAPVKVTAQALAQMQVLRGIKTTKTAQQNKIDSRLYLGLLHERADARLAPLTSFRFVRAQADGRVPVNVIVKNLAGVKPVMDKIAELGGTVSKRNFRVLSFDARVHLADLEALAGLASVKKIRQAMPRYTSVGSATSEGDATHGADEARAFFGVTGAGVKICVMSDGVDSLATSQGLGDLPAVDVLPGQAGSGDEGTAMLEIVHDLAPGATLGFATAADTEPGFAQNILDLAADGCNVIVDDIIWLDESPFEDSPVAQAVNTVTAGGVLYFSSAGNEGNSDDLTAGTWEGDFLASAAADPGPLAGEDLHDFGDGGNSILVEFGGGNPPLLIWAEHYDFVSGQASTDFDLYDMDGGLTTIFDASFDTQDGAGGDDFPIEFIGDGTFGGERLVIDRFAAGSTSSVPMMNLIVFRGELDDNLVTGGATRGHSAAAAAFSVAATPAADSFDGITPDGPFPGLFTSANESESFTSDGPRRVLLDGVTGAELTPGNRTSSGGVVRQKPDITAADGVVTSLPSGPFNPFYGTSAAAPHAAAIAGLLKSAVPAITPAQVRTALIASAIDIETAGVDRDTGAGIIMAHAALLAAGATPQAFLDDGTWVPSQAIGDGDAFVENNEVWNLAIPLTNVGSVNATAISAVLTSATPGVTVTGANSAYPDLAPAASANNTTPYTFAVGAATPCGGRIDFVLTVTYTGGPSPQAFNFSLSTGSAGVPATYSYTGPAVAIPDSAGSNVPGVPASAVLPVVASGYAFDVNFSIDGTVCDANIGTTTVGLDHTFVNDLQLQLTAPSGQSVIVINRTDGSGNNFCQTVLDDESAGANIQSVVNTDAPFTGSFTPNAALSGLDGTPINGNWTLTATDFFTGDTGSIRAFSVIATPAVCDAPALTANVSGTKAVAGTFTEGGAVTYTVSLTNSGTGAQGDNPGNEFTDVLPAGLTLVSASATSGTANANVGTNTVTWDGTIPGGGGTVNITINATINAGTGGTVISNQGTVSYDADGNGTNESSRPTDDAAVLPGTNDPTSFTVAAVDVIAVPTLSPLGLLGLAALLGAAGIALRRRRAA